MTRVLLRVGELFPQVVFSLSSGGVGNLVKIVPLSEGDPNYFQMEDGKRGYLPPEQIVFVEKEVWDEAKRQAETQLQYEETLRRG